MRRLWPRLLIVLAVLGAAHFYIWWRLIGPLPAPWWLPATIALTVLAPSLPVVSLLARSMPRKTARPYLLVGYLWFALATYLLLGAAASQVAVAAGAAPRSAALAGLGGALAVVLAGLVHVARGPRVRRVEIPLPNLPVASYSIVQLSDVHVGPLIGRDFVTRLVEQVNALEPDLIVITGDLVDGRLRELQREIEPMRDLRARDGVWSVTGNHEYYWNAEAWLEHLRSLGIRTLRNQQVPIAGAFTLAGVDDSCADEDDDRQ